MCYYLKYTRKYVRESGGKNTLVSESCLTIGSYEPKKTNMILRQWMQQCAEVEKKVSNGGSQFVGNSSG